MDMTFEDMVRERAYHIWMAAGMQDGQAHEHWASAEHAVATEVSTPAKAPAKKAAAKSTGSKTSATAKKPAAAKKATAKSSKAKH